MSSALSLFAVFVCFCPFVTCLGVHEPVKYLNILKTIKYKKRI
jgi:hypothetical protein